MSKIIAHVARSILLESSTIVISFVCLGFMAYQPL